MMAVAKTLSLAWRSRGQAIRRFGKGAVALGTLAVLALASSGTSAAQTFTSLYTFGSQAGDGLHPLGQLVQDAAGNLYGTTSEGGAQAGGTVFKLDSSGNETVLHSFGAGSDGSHPQAGLILDGSGNLYGTTEGGGTYGEGIVFKVDPSGNETVLHTFHDFNGNDGTNSRAGLILDSAGTLYGTTWGGGSNSYGTVFKLDTSGNETVLHSFTYGDDGAAPVAPLVRDSDGNLYGTTEVGGAHGFGNVFKLDPSGNLTVLHAFGAGTDGTDPKAGLILNAGNLYGTTYSGGSGQYGTVFKIDSGGTYSVLHNFIDSDGAYLQGGVIRDSAGNLYGTTTYGGVSEVGTIFKLDSSGNVTVLHSFSGGGDGRNPAAGLIQDPAGNLYGTTEFGGNFNVGTIFKLSLAEPFSSFSAKLEITSGPPPGYQLNATFTQPAGAPAIHVLSQGITVSIGPSYTLTIPGTAFRQTKQGSFVYQTQSLQVRITETGVNSRTGITSWQVQIDASGVNLTGLSHPSLTLTLGNNSGTTTP